MVTAGYYCTLKSKYVAVIIDSPTAKGVPLCFLSYSPLHLSRFYITYVCRQDD